MRRHWQCPSCQSASVKVIDSRVSGSGCRRRRECGICAHRWTTYELPTEILEAMQRGLASVDIDRLRTTLVDMLSEVSRAAGELNGFDRLSVPQAVKRGMRYTKRIKDAQ